MHQGMTSSDVLDTTLAVQMTRASDLLLSGIDRLLDALDKRAKEHKYTPTIGRSHGIHAEPTTFGLKLATFYAEFKRCHKRLQQAREEIATCAISGAVGTFAHIDPSVEQHVADKMGLHVEPVSTQVIPRDRHAMFFAVLLLPVRSNGLLPKSGICSAPKFAKPKSSSRLARKAHRRCRISAIQF